MTKKNEKLQQAEVKEPLRGLHHHRYEREPLEKVFALAWQKINEETVRFGGSKQHDHVDLLLAKDQNNVRPATKRDKLVAATVIQWLGSSVGGDWLKSVLTP